MKQFIQKVARMSQMALIVLFVHLSTSVVSQLKAQQIIAGETYSIRLDVGSPLTLNYELAGSVILWDKFDGQKNQLWIVKSSGNGKYIIQSKSNGSCLTYASGKVSLTNLAANNIPEAKHLWLITRQANGKFRITHSEALTDLYAAARPSGGYDIKLGLNQAVWSFMIIQENWRWCKSCKALFFYGIAGGVCPANGGGKHIIDINPSTNKVTSSYNYTLSYTKPPMIPAVISTNSHQTGWAWCAKCNVLFATGGTKGICAKDGQPHFGDWSGNYVLNHSGKGGIGQAGWSWCGKCYSLFSGLPGVCPVGGGHTNDGYNYILQFNDF